MSMMKAQISRPLARKFNSLNIFHIIGKIHFSLAHMLV